MIKNILELRDKINLINEQVPSFSTDERKEIKKNNKIINDYISELSLVKDIMIDVIMDKNKKIKPVSNSNLIDEDNIELVKLLGKVKLLSNNNFICKLDIDKCLYDIRYSGSLDKVNDSILIIIDKFKLIDINLNSNDFKYSLSLYKYMDFYFKNNEKDDFDKLISNLFDSLYWECPDIVLHIYLSFMLLLNKYSDKFENYIKKNNENDNYEEYLNKYYNKNMEIYEKINCNEFILYSKFLSGELRIEDYLTNGIRRKEVVSKYIDYDKYLNLEDRNYFYEQINGMYLDLDEYLELSKYKFLIDKVKDIYLNKNNYSNNYISMIKNIKNLDKQREKINKKLFNIYNKLNGKTSGLLFKKYNSLYNKVNNKIMEIIEVYNSFDETCFINDIILKLNDDSTYYDVLNIYENNYSYLVKLLNDNNCNYDDFMKFLYSSNLNICKNIPFVNNIDIKDKLINKYDLFDMNFDLTDDNKFRDELKYINSLWYIEKGNIDLEKFKLIFDTDKIKKEGI